MTVGLQTKSIEEIYEEMKDSYISGEYLDGRTPYGDDALMDPDKFADRFQHICFGFGYREAEIIPMKSEIKEWCQEHLSHLESKFI
tara:strand:+ start:305 stop:562 length:258 start_codon:yes stop_codon:yes gene_type:complete